MTLCTFLLFWKKSVFFYIDLSLQLPTWLQICMFQRNSLIDWSVHLHRHTVYFLKKMLRHPVVNNGITPLLLMFKLLWIILCPALTLTSLSLQAFVRPWKAHSEHMTTSQKSARVSIKTFWSGSCSDFFFKKAHTDQRRMETRGSNAATETSWN